MSEPLLVLLLIRSLFSFWDGKTFYTSPPLVCEVGFCDSSTSGPGKSMGALGIEWVTYSVERPVTNRVSSLSPSETVISFSETPHVTYPSRPCRGPSSRTITRLLSRDANLSHSRRWRDSE